MKIKTSSQRGYNKMDWLESYHSFSFGNYYNPNDMNFSHLRVINEDWIEPHTGFGFHPHKDMEIITFMLDGKIEHKDNLNNVGQLTSGKVQLMRAGAGIVHSEINSFDEQAHLLQIWLTPEEKNLTPGWWEKKFDATSDLEIIAKPLNPEFEITDIAPQAQGDGLKIAQQCYLLKVSKEQHFKFDNEDIYVHAVGDVQIEENGQTYELFSGDALYGKTQGNFNVKLIDGFILMFVLK